MKILLKWIFMSIAILVLLPVLLFSIQIARIQFRMYCLRHADHTQILSACREAITNRHSYRNDKDMWASTHPDDVLLLPPIPTEVPQAIRELNPKYVIIRDDNILIAFPIVPARLGLLGFKEGADQYGTFKYIDGLWFWNGNKSNNPNNGSQ